MLAGLLFATHDAEDRPGTLAATLPFGGLTLIEYQARLLVSLGASQLIVVVQRLTPELLGALARIGRRGASVDAVRSASEAVAKLHPLARVLMLGDGLVTTAAAIGPLAAEGGDALLTLDVAQAPSSLERLGATVVWAGAGRLQIDRIAEVAAMPRDYDMQSALVRVAAQARAQHLMLPPGEASTGHGVERSAAALDARGREVMSATLARRHGWFERWIVAPLARPLLAAMMRSSIPTAALAGVAGAVGVGSLVALDFGYSLLGVVGSLLATMAVSAGSTIAWMRDETLLRRGFAIAEGLFPALAVLLLGHGIDAMIGGSLGLVLALGLILLAALDARAGQGQGRADWQGGPGAFLAVAALPTLLGWPLTGLAIAAGYAAGSLAAAIEMLRRRA
jgi:hypothetical protein